MRFFSKNALLIIVVFHAVGLVGISLVNKELFAELSPLNLLLSTLLILLCHQGSAARLAWLFAGSFLGGFFVEVLGLHTGFPFGSYWYGDALGPKIAGVPLIMGVNWFLMVIGAGYLAQMFTSKSVYQVLIAALAMTMLDLVIEPVAPQLDYWYWEEGPAPVLNYLGWFAVSIVMQILFQNTLKYHSNSLAVPHFLVLGVFFVVLNFSL